MNQIKRSKLKTAIIAFFFPSVAMLYIGRWKGTILYSFLHIIKYCGYAGSILVTLGAIFDCLRCLKKTDCMITHSWYTKWYITVPLAIISTLSYFLI